ncbi:flagellar biosynthetic protein FliR [Exilibacterium tricleocarpae]|uniref:Flagellar biosynthetic protein FliR n=1 Tax=Exilibacterium tricleocarpae TaxID=2591008 RepID=A0A545T884_9GAMM|nr:flagellar biosynthetic protein FliR [Exilibacterium tricleocarpae]TQV73398.1 flagellar biosynthetic protein FliR [Exilibacterium tricleocarpae]
MRIEADMLVISAVLLMFIRLSALFLLTPLFVAAPMPVTVRTLFFLALAFMLIAGLSATPATLPQTLSEWFIAAAQELLIGAVMAFGLFAAFAVFLFGGRILDFQMGFGVANLIDPATQTQGPLLGTILNLMAVMTFFLLDGHHLLIRGIAFSLQQVPIGQSPGALRIDEVVMQFGIMFTFGLMLVAPAVFSLLLLDVGLAVSARTMPQVNIFIVGLPLKIFVGLVVLALSLNYMSPLLKRVFASIFRYWERVLG